MHAYTWGNGIQFEVNVKKNHFCILAKLMAFLESGEGLIFISWDIHVYSNPTEKHTCMYLKKNPLQTSGHYQNIHSKWLPILHNILRKLKYKCILHKSEKLPGEYNDRWNCISKRQWLAFAYIRNIIGFLKSRNLGPRNTLCKYVKNIDNLDDNCN